MPSAGGRPSQSAVFDLNDAVAESEAFLGRLLGAHVEIRTSLAPGGCPVDADRSQIEQVLMNLGVNARDAMPDGGRLTIETETVDLYQLEANARFEAPGGEYALLRVTDTGVGMDAETRARALEPFFTTKPPGEGTGLGLAMVFGSVRQSGGYLSLASEPGAGTTFEILLPLAAAPAPAPAASPTPPAPSRRGGGERVLLVEDEPAVRALACEILADQGYDVVTASDGEEAARARGRAAVRPRGHGHGDAEARRQGACEGAATAAIRTFRSSSCRATRTRPPRAVSLRPTTSSSRSRSPPRS